MPSQHASLLGSDRVVWADYGDLMFMYFGLPRAGVKDRYCGALVLDFAEVGLT